MKKWIAVAIVLAIVIVGMNDFGRTMRAISSLNAQAKTVSGIAVDAARGGGSSSAGLSAARDAATAGGVVITAYEVGKDGVSVSVRSYVTGTWVVGPFLALQAHQPLSTPFAIDSKSFAFYR